MILKVANLDDGSWIFWDKIEIIKILLVRWKYEESLEPEELGNFSFHVEYPSKGLDFPEKIHPDYICVDFQGNPPSNQGTCKIANVIKKSTDSNGDMLFIAFSKGYLLSDEGITIEKL